MTKLVWDKVTPDRLEGTYGNKAQFIAQMINVTGTPKEPPTTKWSLYKNGHFQGYQETQAEVIEYTEKLCGLMKDTTTNTQLVVDFEVACVALSWMGAQPPETYNGIKARYREAREKLRKALAGV